MSSAGDLHESHIWTWDLLMLHDPPGVWTALGDELFTVSRYSHVSDRSVRLAVPGVPGPSSGDGSGGPGEPEFAPWLEEPQPEPELEPESEPQLPPESGSESESDESVAYARGRDMTALMRVLWDQGRCDEADLGPAVVRLCEAGADLNTSGYPPYEWSRRTVLLMAAERAPRSTIEYLLYRGATLRPGEPVDVSDAQAMLEQRMGYDGFCLDEIYYSESWRTLWSEPKDRFIRSTDALALLMEMCQAGGWAPYLAKLRLAHCRIRFRVAADGAAVADGGERGDKELLHFVYGRNPDVVEPPAAAAAAAAMHVAPDDVFSRVCAFLC